MPSLVTNNSNGVQDYETEVLMTLLVPEVAAEVVKDLVNTTCALRYRNEHDVCVGKRYCSIYLI
ncbi:DUF1869 domain-containing protein [Salmonella enterica subsp. enterica serovar Weltevreden]|nr:DUF1869 domain-containing protein [Salmonella enterica subsp. enterica serovar Weltevreden]